MSLEFRTGLGWDTHRTAPDRDLILGGVKIENAGYGLLGHSDADVVLHALTDALLGAAGLGDIGQHFPDTDPRWKGAASAEFLTHACRLAGREDWLMVNVDCTIILEQPKLKNWRDQIRESIARILELDSSRVNVKFKTAEGLGPVGEGKSVEAQAIVLIARPVDDEE